WYGSYMNCGEPGGKTLLSGVVLVRSIKRVPVGQQQSNHIVERVDRDDHRETTSPQVQASEHHRWLADIDECVPVPDLTFMAEHERGKRDCTTERRTPGHRSESFDSVATEGDFLGRTRSHRDEQSFANRALGKRSQSCLDPRAVDESAHYRCDDDVCAEHNRETDHRLTDETSRFNGSPADGRKRLVFDVAHESEER